MIFWSFPKGSRATYLGNSTLRKGEDPNIMRTVGHGVQADINTQSLGRASWYLVRVRPRPVSQTCVGPVQSQRISHLEDSNCSLIPGLMPRWCPFRILNTFLNKGPSTLSMCWVVSAGIYEGPGNKWSSGSGAAYSAGTGSADPSLGLPALSMCTWDTYAQYLAQPHTASWARAIRATIVKTAKWSV